MHFLPVLITTCNKATSNRTVVWVRIQALRDNLGMQAKFISEMMICRSWCEH